MRNRLGEAELRRLYPRQAADYIAPTGAVMSVLRTGYVFCPSGKKKRCVRRAHTFWESGVNASTGRGYNPSAAPRRDSSPSIRSEAPSFIVARAATPLVFGAKHQTQNVVRQSRTNILPKIHRGAEIRSANARCEPCKGEAKAPPKRRFAPQS